MEVSCPNIRYIKAVKLNLKHCFRFHAPCLPPCYSGVNFMSVKTQHKNELKVKCLWQRTWEVLLLLYSRFNKCPYQLPRPYKRQEENKSKIGQERSFMLRSCSLEVLDHQCHRPTPWMQEIVSMHKSPTPVRHSGMNQAKVGRRGRETGKTQARQEADGKKGSPTKQKPIRVTKTKPTCTAQDNKARGWKLTSYKSIISFSAVTCSFRVMKS